MITTSDLPSTFQLPVWPGFQTPSYKTLSRYFNFTLFYRTIYRSVIARDTTRDAAEGTSLCHCTSLFWCTCGLTTHQETWDCLDIRLVTRLIPGYETRWSSKITGKWRCNGIMARNNELPSWVPWVVTIDQDGNNMIKWPEVNMSHCSVLQNYLFNCFIVPMHDCKVNLGVSSKLNWTCLQVVFKILCVGLKQRSC